MKKILTKFLTVMIIAAIAVTSFSGCLISTVPEKDMAQAVATVRISDDVNTDSIYKSEMVSAFVSYGYMYVQSYGYTQSAAYETILKNLVQNRVIVQQARIELAKLYNELIKDDKKADTDFKKYFLQNASAKKSAINAKEADASDPVKYAENLRKYLTEYEIAKADYNVRLSINNAIDQYVEKDEEEEKKQKEEETYTLRTAPKEDNKTAQFEYELRDGVEGFVSDPAKYTPAEYDYKKADVTLKKGTDKLQEEYKTLYDLNKAVYDNYAIDNGYVTKMGDAEKDRISKRKNAYNKMLKTLSGNGLDKFAGKTEAEKGNFKKEPEKHPYFIKNVISQYESAIVAKYEESLISEVEKNMTPDALWDQYMSEYKYQKENSTSDAYETALDAVSKDVFVMCNPYEGYGYVANILIGFNDEQTKQLKDAQAEKGSTAEKVAAKRSELLGQLTAKDQRESWVYSSYGKYDKESGNFTFDDKYLVSKEGAAHDMLSVYQGEVYGGKESTDENKDKVPETKWHFDNVVPDSISFDSFIDTYVTPLTGIEKKIYVKGDDTTVGKIELDDEKRTAVDDLLFAFSTDPGCLGKYYGYIYSPFTSDKKYVKEFADASNKVVKAGKGAYTIVATDFGYHLIVCTKQVTGEDDVYKEDSEAQFKEDLKNEDSFAYKYREIKLDHVTKDEVNKIANKFIKDYMDEKNGHVKYNKKTYSDLIPEPKKDEDKD